VPININKVSTVPPIINPASWVSPGVLNLSQFLGLFFTLFLFPEGGMVGKRAASIWVFRQKFRSAKLLPEIEFNAARLPTLQIWGEKKVAKIPEI